MTVSGNYGEGRPFEVLSDYQERGSNIIGLQETRRACQPALVEAQRRGRRRGRCEDGPRRQQTVNPEEYYPCPKAPTGVHQRTAPEGDARAVWSSQSCDVCRCVCPKRRLKCCKKSTQGERLLAFSTSHGLACKHVLEHPQEPYPIPSMGEAKNSLATSS